MRIIVASFLICTFVAASSEQSLDAVPIPTAHGAAPQGTDTTPEVRLVAMRTDIATRIHGMVPAIPLPPFSSWRRWLSENSDAVHCVLEWRTEDGDWHYAELRSTRFMANMDGERVGWGELACTAYDAYGIYINRGRIPRETNHLGQPVEVTLDEKIDCDYRRIEEEIRRYGAREFGRCAGCPGDGSANCKLGGPAFTPTQNSNTMVNHVLKACGVARKAPDRAVGWDTIPHFPRSTNRDTFDYDSP